MISKGRPRAVCEKSLLLKVPAAGPPRAGYRVFTQVGEPQVQPLQTGMVYRGEYEGDDILQSCDRLGIMMRSWVSGAWGAMAATAGGGAAVAVASRFMVVRQDELGSEMRGRCRERGGRERRAETGDRWVYSFFTYPIVTSMSTHLLTLVVACSMTLVLTTMLTTRMWWILLDPCHYRTSQKGFRRIRRGMRVKDSI